MDRAEKKVKTLSEAELKKIFDAVRRGKSRDCVCSLLKPRDPTTVRRVYNVALEFQNRGLEVLDDDAAGQIAVKAKYGVNIRRVEALFIAWQHWKTGGNKRYEEAQWLRQQHLDRLLRAVDPIRKCVFNPWESWAHANPGPPLWIGSHDWALVPRLWFSVVTPNFDDESDWGRAFPQLKMHLEKSPFWDDLAELERMTYAVAEDLEIAANKYGSLHDDFQIPWGKLQKRITSGWDLQDSRTPRHPVPDWEKIKPPYGDLYARHVCEALAGGIMPDVYDRLWALVSQLDVVRNDLEPGVVDRVIAEGTCPDCPG